MASFLYQHLAKDKHSSLGNIVTMKDGVLHMAGQIAFVDPECLKNSDDIGKSLALIMTAGISFADLQEALASHRSRSDTWSPTDNGGVR